MTEELLRLQLADEQDVFSVRQIGRQVAAAAGLDVQDQVRVATALSEIGRELFSHSGRVSVLFRLDRGDAPALVIELGYTSSDGSDRPRDGDTAAARLMDRVEETSTPSGRVVRLRKNLPLAVPAAGLATALRAEVARLRPVTALEDLRTQNAELIQALEDLRRQREELRSLNAELEETNQGVMALYNELSAELEETNRGVVALYAELEEKSEQLREAGAAKNRFWANISHELRTPVNGVIGLARLLLDPAADPLTAEQKHQISLIVGAGETLLSLVTELLDMAKAEQGRLAPRRTPVEVAPLLSQLSELLTPVAHQAGVALRMDAGDAADAVLVTDEVMLTRILRNVVANGLKFTEKGEVRLTVRSTPDHLEFVVTDTGIGIPVGEQERVFEEFYQVPGTKPGGTGLGLTYSRRLATVLDGDLSLASEPGAGTTVTLRLPRQRRLIELGLSHVLVADARPEDRALLRGMLEDVPGRLSEAADGRAVRGVVEADPPDLLLLGPGLPPDCAAEILAELPPPVAVVLVTSGAADDTGRDRADAVLDQAQLVPVMLADAVARARRASKAR
ncbi:ATP-binding protein [Spirillospora sp. NPDC049652]